MKREFEPRRLDVKRFAEQSGRLASDAPLRDYERLLAEAQGRGADTPVSWAAEGELRNPGHLHPEVWLHLRAGTTLALICQRCLHPVEVDLALQRSFRFAPDEATAAAEDDEAEEEVLALSHSFDLQALVEDELLMDLPLAPRHAECPEQLPTAAGEDEFEQAQARRENPFAALGKLKGG